MVSLPLYACDLRWSGLFDRMLVHLPDETELRDEPRLTISDKLIRLRVQRAKIEPRFLDLSLASPFSQEHFVQRKTGLADAQVSISQAILKATPVAYPQLGQGVAVNVLKRFGVELEALRQEVEQCVDRGGDNGPIEPPPFAPGVKKVFALAKKEAAMLHHTYIGTEHLLLGLLREREGVVARVLESSNVSSTTHVRRSCGNWIQISA